MTKFLVLYMADRAAFEKMMKDSTPEQQKKGMEAWMNWMNENKTSLVDGGAPLGKTKRVDSNGASSTKNEIEFAVQLLGALEVGADFFAVGCLDLI